MIYTVIIHDRDEERAHTYRIQTIKNDIDVKQACRYAAMDFVTTQTGFEIYTDRCSANFDWGDFFCEIPQEICFRHGFIILEDDSVDVSVDANEPMFTKPTLHAQIEWKEPLYKTTDLPGEINVPLETLLRDGENLSNVRIEEYKSRVWKYANDLYHETPITIKFI